ncbi:MAG: tetratricopeptide repeat protein, partial [Gammaproteobacteria bacterium]|nr:tetratricopeptide repeat protein [Gammaproteobacteria bacterium]
ERNSRLYGAQAPEFLRTHPVNQTRIADARNRASQLPARPMSQQQSYLLMQKRLQVLTSKDKQQTLRAFEKNINSGNYLDQNAENYGYALALIENKQYDKSRQIIKSLLEKDSQRIAYMMALTDLESQAGNHKVALQLYNNALASYPGNYPLTQNYIEALLRAQQYQTAQTILHTYLRTHYDKPVMYQLLSQTENKLGHDADAQAALGEYYFLIGQQHQAITQLTLALKTEGLSFYDNTRIEARIKQIQEEIIRLKEIFKE